MLKKVSSILYVLGIVLHAPVVLCGAILSLWLAFMECVEFIYIYIKIMTFHEVRMNTGNMPEYVWKKLVKSENIEIISGGGYNRLFLWNPPK